MERCDRFVERGDLVLQHPGPSRGPRVRSGRPDDVVCPPNSLMSATLSTCFLITPTLPDLPDGVGSVLTGDLPAGHQRVSDAVHGAQHSVELWVHEVVRCDCWPRTRGYFERRGPADLTVAQYAPQQSRGQARVLSWGTERSILR